MKRPGTQHHCAPFLEAGPSPIIWPYMPLQKLAPLLPLFCFRNIQKKTKKRKRKSRGNGLPASKSLLFQFFLVPRVIFTCAC